MHKFSCWLLPLLIITTCYAGATLRVQAARPSELFFSEYVEGSSNNKALELFNGTGAPISLATQGYNIQIFFNGATTAGVTINLTGTVANDDVYVIANSSANAAVLAEADQTSGGSWFNGDDAIVLRKGTTILDVIGQVGFDRVLRGGAARFRQVITRYVAKQTTALATLTPATRSIPTPNGKVWLTIRLPVSALILLCVLVNPPS